MGHRGPKPAPPSELFAFAQLFYWDFRALAEGTSRSWFDKERYYKTASNFGKTRSNILDWMNNEQISINPKEGQLTQLVEDLRWIENHGRHLEALDEATVEKRVPGEPDVLKKLLAAKTPERIRQICDDAFVIRCDEVRAGEFRNVRVANWPIPEGSTFPYYLSKHADQFLAAKSDSRFPRSDRPSNQLKQLWFLSRALAGALYNLSVRTSLNLVGSLRPEQIFEESGAAKPVRSRKH
jgi:hypothetical protein